ncbi:MAG: hypothetical protein KDI16_09075 [Halioglobus sp.]|nr:hypothetical protein [Halioglobus sp.]
MALKQRLQNLAMSTVDGFMARVPRKVPGATALCECKIISHRGEHDNRTVMENTLTAFDNTRAAGVWGLECDIRWTRDMVPVICHDPDLRRVFGDPAAIAGLTLAELRERAPAVPTLRDVLLRYGGSQHLMLEVKACDPAQLPQQRAVLGDLLARLQPAVDFHILALDTALFTLVDFLPPACLLPVAEMNVARLSREALQRGYAGIVGHYLLLNRRLQCRHRAAGQRIGTGFPRSERALLREIGRGVDWVFSNDAAYLQRKLDALRSQAVSVPGPMH